LNDSKFYKRIDSYKLKPTFSRTVKESKSAALWNTCSSKENKNINYNSEKYEFAISIVSQ